MFRLLGTFGWKVAVVEYFNVFWCLFLPPRPSRRSGVLLLPVHRAGPEDVRGVDGSWFWRAQHAGGPAAGPRREDHLPAAARLRRRRRGAVSETRRPEDHHPAQRDAGTHGVPHLRHQTQNMRGLFVFSASKRGRGLSDWWSSRASGPPRGLPALCIILSSCHSAVCLHQAREKTKWTLI